MVTAQKLRELQNARPFQRFIIRLADGREIPVNHPEWMMILPSGRIAHVTQKDDSVNFIDVLLITDLEVRPPAKARAAG